MTPLHYLLLGSSVSYNEQVNIKGREESYDELIKIIKFFKINNVDLTIEAKLNTDASNDNSNLMTCVPFNEFGPDLLSTQRYKPIDIMLSVCTHIVGHYRNKHYEIIQLLLPYTKT